jgi:hypothetical protein
LREWTNGKYVLVVATKSKGQSNYNHITHLELVDRALEKERCTLNNKQ